LASFSVIEPSLLEEIFTYIKLNIPTPYPPRGACPWSTGGAPVASFIDDVPGRATKQGNTSRLEGLLPKA
jgi:hypothetical protein